MKIKSITLALIALLSTAVFSCQKEDNIIEPSIKKTCTDQTGSYAVLYSLDGTFFFDSIHYGQEEEDLMCHLITMAYSGMVVTIEEYTDSITCLSSAFSPNASDKTKVITTSSASEISTWTLQRVHEGYKVTVIYNSSTGQYTGIATKKTSVSIMQQDNAELRPSL